MLLLGTHMSIADGFDQAVWRGLALGCQSLQIFVKAPNRWGGRPLDPAEVARFKEARFDAGIEPVFAHGSYLINLASPDPGLWRRSLEAFQDEVERCQVLGLPYLVIHVGSHRGEGEAAGLRRIVRALDLACEATASAEVRILLETTAGQGDTLGHRFEQLAWLIEEAACPERLGICFDTAHAFAAGYELRTPEGYAQTFDRFERVLGLEWLQAFHLNDSQRELGSRRDRHAHIGEGELGLESFRLLLNDERFRELPMVLETPKDPLMQFDRRNLALLRGLLGDQWKAM